MHILAIDAGSYSVKYVSSSVDKRKITHLEMSEIVILDYWKDHQDLTEQEVRASIIHEVIDSIARHDTRIIFQADNDMMTTRFLTLPVKSKKKAELMLPFQLEEDIPYALSEIHYAYRMEPQKSQNVALVSLAREDLFEGYFNLFKERDALPNILTTEASIVENYFNQNSIAGPFCVLDIGHRTTKGYFFYNSRLLVTHMSYTGGQDINEMIAQTYDISSEEAITYKHQNAFLLTSSQHQGVEQAQKEFAVAMDRVFAPLIADFARWKVGFKVNLGLSISHVFICGGTSNVKNIANYLTEKLETKVALLESFDKVELGRIDLTPKNKTKFALTNMMASSFRRKNRFINLLNGRFAQTSSAELPLHSLAFIGIRVTVFSLILAISMVAERIFLDRDITYVNKRIASLIKSPELGITGRLRRSINTDPTPVNRALTEKKRSIQQEISTLQASISIQALSPLVTVSQIVADTTAILTKFQVNENNELTAVFKSEEIEELKQLKGRFELSSLNEVSVQVNEVDLSMTVKAVGL